jgi:septal ring factor EnvC (AmiA/AmiB activator)
MGDSNQVFTITFRTEAELDAAKRTLAATEAVSAAQKQGASEAKENSQAEQELGKAYGETGQATEAFTTKKSVLIKSLKELRHEIPGLSEVIHLLRNPLILVGSLMAMAAAAIRKFREEVDEMELKAMAFERISERMGKFKNIAAEMRGEAAAFATSLGAIQSAAEGAAGAFDRLNKEIERQGRLEAEKRNAKMAEDLEKVDEQEQAGAISHSRATQMRGGIKARYDAEQRRQERLKPLAEAVTADKAVAEAQPELDDLQKQAALAREQVKQAKAKQKVDAATTKPTEAEATEKLGTLQKDLQKARDTKIQIAQSGRINDWIASIAPAGSAAASEPAAAAQFAEKKIQEIQRDIKAQEQTLDNIAGQEVDAESKVKAAQTKLSTLETKITTLTQNIAGWKKKSSDLMKDYSASAREQDKVEKTLADTAARKTKLDTQKARQEENERFGKAFQQSGQSGEPMPPDIQREMKVRAQEDRPARITPVQPRQPSGAGQPRGHNLSQEEMTARGAGAEGNYLDADYPPAWHLPDLDRFPERGRPPQARHMPEESSQRPSRPWSMFDGQGAGQGNGKEVEAIGKQITQSLIQNGQVTIAALDKILTVTQQNTASIAALAGRLSQVKNHADLNR